MYSGKKPFKSREGKNERSESGRTTGKFHRDDKEHKGKPFRSREVKSERSESTITRGKFQRDDKEQAGKPKRVIKIIGKSHPILIANHHHIMTEKALLILKKAVHRIPIKKIFQNHFCRDLKKVIVPKKTMMDVFA